MIVCNDPFELIIFSVNQASWNCTGCGPTQPPIKKEKIKDVWNSEDFINRRKSLLSGANAFPCDNCTEYHSKRGLSKKNNKIITDYNETFLDFKPKYVSVHITTKCNMRCRYCQNVINNHSRIDMDIDFFEEIARNYFNSAEHVNLNCAGEIFLYKHQKRFYEIIKKYKPKHSELLTNGSFYINKEKWDFITDHIDCISFSVDAYSKEKHYINRGFDLSVLEDNVDRLKILKEKKKIEMIFTFVIMRNNVDEIFQFVKKCFEEYDADKVFLNPISGPFYDNESVFNNDYYKSSYNTQFEKIKEYEQKLNLHGKIFMPEKSEVLCRNKLFLAKKS